MGDIISALTALTTPASGDLVPVVDVSDTAQAASGSTRKVTIADLLKVVFTSVALQGDISPAQITSNQNDYNPTGLATAGVLRLSSDAARNVTGIAAQAAHQGLHIADGHRPPGGKGFRAHALGSHPTEEGLAVVESQALALLRPGVEPGEGVAIEGDDALLTGRDLQGALAEVDISGAQGDDLRYA